MSVRGNAGGTLTQLHRSLTLTDKALAVLDRARAEERAARLGPPPRPHCLRCDCVLAECTCLEKKLAGRS